MQQNNLYISNINDLTEITKYMHNVFISHYGEDEPHLDSLKARLKNNGCDVRNSSIEKKDYRKDPVSDATIAKEIRSHINWAKTFIVMLGEHTHERPWVNYEIRYAARQGKTIVGIYEFGCKDNIELPEAYKRYGGSLLGWNSLDKLEGIMKGQIQAPETPNSDPAGPIYNIIRIICK